MKNLIKGVIYDMDGLIINSEPLWKIAIIESFKEIGFDFTFEMCTQTTGMRIDEVVNFWWNKLKWQNFTQKEVISSIEKKMIYLIKYNGELLPGVLDSLKLLNKAQITIALASSSSMTLINTTLDSLKIRKYFQFIHSAEKEIAGKPNPAVFLSTAKSMKIFPKNCLVLEDSKAGMLAGLNAKMRTIVIPEQNSNSDWAKYSFKTLKSLKEFQLNLLN
jgi:HAD superfamily hydrolase (TIGR01509 family)